MGDVVPPHVRSKMMSGIRSANTKPELQVRSGLHRLGHRFRLHEKRLPGTPDLVFPRRGAALFVHGCFWHGHGCHLFKWPRSRSDFWRSKIARNREVDFRAETLLTQLGWRRGVVWECALRGKLRMPQIELMRELDEWLRSDRDRIELSGGAENNNPAR